ncbi:MAG: glycoside hydrolase family 9 protein, partial [Elusimicrobiota bacterium]|nr:glycoside hydrolase family 9 protein [Endomicrobiia bacterium]MDW8166566.1 glycoside hydrolase family 9 protein [Elusimicrobiota bacterium]
IFLYLFFIIVIKFYSYSSEFIKINQIGYLPQENKIFFVSTQPVVMEFRIKDINNKVVYSSTLSYRGYDSSSGDEIYMGDFTSLTLSGTYYIEVPYLGSSDFFIISNDVYFDLFVKSLRAFLLQRCGCELNEPELKHKVCHSKDGELFLSGKPLKVNAVGGWHDAGDYGKYIVNLGVSVGTLIHIFELVKDKFKDRQLFLPNNESYDGVADILNEIKYGISWIFEMQNKQTGGVYHKLTAKNFEPLNILPDADYSDRYIIDLSRGTTYSIETTAATGNFIGMLAGAYRVFKENDYNFAIKCLSAALKAWEFLEKNPTIIPPSGFRNPDEVYTGEYGDSNDTDERLWAAAELFKATLDNKFSQYFETNYSPPNSPISWQNLKNLAIYAYYFSSSASESFKQRIYSDVRNYANSLLSRIQSNFYNVVLRNTEYYWGSNSVLLNYAIDLIYAYEITKDENYRIAALEQLHYILGRNATGFCYVTGFGKKSPKSIHHRPSIALNKTLPGFLVGGPNSRGNDPTLSEFIRTYNPPPAKCYIDHYEAYACNEIAINWNAPLVFVVSYFLPQNIDFITMSPIDLKIKYPLNNSKIRGITKLDFVIYCSTELKKIEIFLNDHQEVILSSFTDSYLLDTTKYEDGNYELKIKVEDIDGNIVERSVPVEIINKYFSKFSEKMLLSLNNDNVNNAIDFSNNLNLELKEVNIYNIKGKLVKSIKKPPFIWYGKDNLNRTLSSGVYIYYIKTKDDKTKKGIITIFR